MYGVVKLGLLEPERSHKAEGGGEPSTVASIAAGASPHRREPGMLCDARQRMDTLQQLGGIIQKAKGEMALRIIFRRWTGTDSLAREVNKKLEILAAP